MYLWRPAPIALLAATVHLAVAGYSLLARPALDGDPISKERPELHILLTVIVAAAGAALLVTA
jgi:hypothetical protein